MVTVFDPLSRHCLYPPRMDNIWEVSFFKREGKGRKAACFFSDLLLCHVSNFSLGKVDTVYFKCACKMVQSLLSFQ